MRKTTLALITSILITTSISAQDTVSNKLLMNNENCTWQLKNATIPFTGVSCTYYRFGKIKRLVSFENGIIEGRTITYYKNGKEKCEGECHNGELNGPSIWFDKQGNKTTIIYYQNHMKNGEQLWFNTVGNITARGQWFNDKKSGVWTVYDESGTLVESINYDTKDTE